MLLRTDGSMILNFKAFKFTCLQGCHVYVTKLAHWPIKNSPNIKFKICHLDTCYTVMTSTQIQPENHYLVVIIGIVCFHKGAHMSTRAPYQFPSFTKLDI